MNYAGMIIGGPKDGEIWEHATDYLQIVSSNDPHFPYSADQEPIGPVSYEVTTYRHMIGLRGEFNLDFWVSTEDFRNNIGRVLEHIFQNYREYAAVKRREEKRYD